MCLEEAEREEDEDEACMTLLDEVTTLLVTIFFIDFEDEAIELMAVVVDDAWPSVCWSTAVMA